MTPVTWNDALVLNFGPMDGVHQEFIGLLARAQAADDGQFAEAWRAVIEHTESHFGQEDAWMTKTRFSTGENHRLQHRVVLNLMREGLALARAGNLVEVRQMADELASWFVKHTQSLDAALALHLRSVSPLKTAA